MFRVLWSAIRTAGGLLWDTLVAWRDDHASLMAAALAYYTLISIAPLLIFGLSVVGSVYGAEQAKAAALAGAEGLLGSQVVGPLRRMIDSAARQGDWTATLLGLGIVLYGSTRLFGELQRALRAIWGRHDDPPPLRWPRLLPLLHMLRTQAFSFLMVIGIVLLWLAGIVGTTTIAAVDAWMNDRFPHELELAASIHTLGSVGLLTVFLTLVYRLIPPVRVRWGDALLGSLLTALLLTGGQKLIGLYLGHKTISSVYGAAGSLVIVVFWAYYSWWIFFLGAEFTKVYRQRRRAG